MRNDDILFWKIDWHRAVIAQKTGIEEHVLEMGQDALQVDCLEDIASDLCRRFSLVPPTLHLDQVEVSQKEVDVEASSRRRSFNFEYTQPVYKRGTEVTIRLPFTGDEGMFQLKPTTFTMDIPRGRVIGGSVYHQISGISLDKKRLNDALYYWLKSIEEWIGFQHQSVGKYLEELRDYAMQCLRARKAKLEADNDLISGLGYKTA
ncbi:MAG: hypothetical protein AAF922_12170 [Pseudomonadota bacterium]